MALGLTCKKLYAIHWELRGEVRLGDVEVVEGGGWATA